MTTTEQPVGPRWLQYVNVDDLVFDPLNPKGHADKELDDSLQRFGYTEPVSVDERTGFLSSGHGRVGMVRRARDAGDALPDGIVVTDAGEWLIPVNRGWRSKNDMEARAYLVAANRLTERGGWLDDPLASVLTELRSADALDGTGFTSADLDELLDRLAAQPDPTPAEPAGPGLAERFLVPPFSVLDARQGYWQDRKRAWLALGIRSEEGRAHNLLKMSDTVLGNGQPNRSVPASNSGNDPAYYWKKRAAEKQAGRELTNAEFEADYYEADAYVGGTSIFDPVLCEIAYRWYAPPGGRVLDPFAGGSVRGVVAGRLDLAYRGVELRGEQVETNREQAERIVPRETPEWTQGDSARVLADTSWEPDPFDLLFSCPPYFDLEVYSDEPGDLSNVGSYDEFLLGYRQIIAQAAGRLAPDRFAVWVVGDIRGPDGAVRGLVGDTIAAFGDAGMALHNDAILVTAVGSVALRAARIFSGARRLARSHQYVLVFIKGDPRRAVEACGPIEAADIAAMFGEPLQDEPGEPPAAPEPAWARGRSVERLRAVGRLWAAHDQGIVQGAFARMTESDLAAAADVGSLRVWSDAGGEPVAAAIVEEVRQPKRGRPWLDFRKHKTATIPAGTVMVRRLACRSEHAGALVGELGQLGVSAMEGWVEHPVDRSIAASLGLDHAGTKIAASSEQRALWLTGPTVDLPFVDAVGLIRLDVDVRSEDAAAAATEVAGHAGEFADHYAVYNARRSWQALALRGYGGDPSFIIKPAEMSKKWKAEHPAECGWELADSPLAEQLPVCWELANSLPGALHRVRLMRLRAGDGELTRHADITDPDAGWGDGQLARVHVPLATNDGVLFSSWLPDGSRQHAHMAAGEAWTLDTRKPHTAVNQGPTDRLHLVVDVEVTPALREVAVNSGGAVHEAELADVPEPREPLAPWPV